MLSAGSLLSLSERVESWPTWKDLSEGVESTAYRERSLRESRVRPTGKGLCQREWRVRPTGKYLWESGEYGLQGKIFVRESGEYGLQGKIFVRESEEYGLQGKEH